MWTNEILLVISKAISTSLVSLLSKLGSLKINIVLLHIINDNEITVWAKVICGYPSQFNRQFVLISSAITKPLYTVMHWNPVAESQLGMVGHQSIVE